MPDPLLYLAATGAAAIAAALLVLAIAWPRQTKETKKDGGRLRVAAVLSIAGGLIAGYFVLRLRVSWPPVNALDRWLTIVLPLALGVELVAAFEQTPRWLAWTLRLALAATASRILLHGSVYLTGSEQWTLGQTTAMLFVAAALTATLWVLLAWLAERSPPGVSIPLGLALAIQSAGVAIMLAGYLTGGAAALPLSAALVGTIAVSRLLASSPDVQSPIGIGVIGLSGLVFIGRFFGGLSTGAALALLLAPLLCWATELPSLRKRPAWVVGTLRLLLVAIPLIVVLVLAKRDFDRDTAPLLVQRDAAGSVWLCWSVATVPRSVQEHESR